ncbi:V-type ATP synthase subunit I [Acholeplasma palmae]|uniref:V-type ATP synthase subunit I n=1 Tax=Acholeplasma palmae TaxID=38986 RepID=UPI0038B2B2B5
MFTLGIAKMKLVTISSELTNLEQVLKRFIEFPEFHPISSEQFVDRVRGLKTFSSSNPFKSLLDEIIEIESEFNFKLPVVKQENLEYNIDQMHDNVVIIHEKLKQEILSIRKLESDINLHQLAIDQIHNIDNLKVSLDDIFSCKFLYVRFGRIPMDSQEKIKYYRNKPFVFKEFSQIDGHIWCMYMMTEEYKQEIDNMFATLFFERIRIPEFVHGTPDKAEKQLQENLAKMTEQLKVLKDQLDYMKNSCMTELSTTKAELEFLGKLYEARKYVVGLGERFSISGFIVKKDADKFKQHFEGISDLEIEVRPANSDKRITPPTKLSNNWFSKPFEMFVEMYGTPSYKDIDPTLFVSITYTLLFGIMFGDVGQGLLMSLIGFLLSKYKKLPLGKIISRIGISSAVFGLAYGSFFGDEKLLPGLYEKYLGIHPIEVMNSSVTMNLLIATVLLGAVLILSAIIMNIYVKFKNKDYIEGTISNNGIMGLLFYGFILIGIVLNMQAKINLFNIYTILLLIGIPLLVIFFKEPLERKLNKEKAFPNGFGGFFIEGFFELFEVMLSYVTNTMSFLRVGGFILSHAGMMLVVHTLMEMTGQAGIVVSIFGNIFVMGLEGLIVGIQVLRLEFYEMFSRYYEGDGIPFTPIKF